MPGGVLMIGMSEPMVLSSEEQMAGARRWLPGQFVVGSSIFQDVEVDLRSRFTALISI